MDTFIDKSYVYVVVGVEDDPDTQGYKVVQELEYKGYTVFPIHQYAEEIAGVECMPSLVDVPDRPDVVIYVGDEDNAIKTVVECHELELNRIWGENGSLPELAVEEALKYGMKVHNEDSILHHLH